MDCHIVKMHKDKEVNKNVNNNVYQQNRYKSCQSSTKFSEEGGTSIVNHLHQQPRVTWSILATKVNVKNTFTSHIDKHYFWHFCWPPHPPHWIWYCFDNFCTYFVPILFQYCYKYCYSDSRNFWVVVKAGGLEPSILIQPTISLEMPVPSQGHYSFHSFPVVGMILSVYILMSFDFLFGGLFGVR
jgi:hypothetical protein